MTRSGPVTHGEMEAFTQDGLEHLSDRQVTGEMPRGYKGHVPKEFLGAWVKNLPDALWAAVEGLHPEVRRTDLRYPEEKNRMQVPFRLADEAEAKSALKVMDDVLEYVRAQAALDP